MMTFLFLQTYSQTVYDGCDNDDHKDNMTAIMMGASDETMDSTVEEFVHHRAAPVSSQH